MANALNTDKQIAVIGALTEGSSIRSIERMTGVHRDTIQSFTFLRRFHRSPQSEPQSCKSYRS